MLSLQLDRRYTPRWCIFLHACISLKEDLRSIIKRSYQTGQFAMLCLCFDRSLTTNHFTQPYLLVTYGFFVIASYTASICLSSNVCKPGWKRKHDSHNSCRPIVTCYVCMCAVHQHICSQLMNDDWWERILPFSIRFKNTLYLPCQLKNAIMKPCYLVQVGSPVNTWQHCCNILLGI